MRAWDYRETDFEKLVFVLQIHNFFSSESSEALSLGE